MFKRPQIIDYTPNAHIVFYLIISDALILIGLVARVYVRYFYAAQ